jgi:hypothetical protein
VRRTWLVAAFFAIAAVIPGTAHASATRMPPPSLSQTIAVKVAVKLPKPAPPLYYVVRKGDTLSSIAKRFDTNWQALWWVNRDKVPNPNLILAGTNLRLSKWHPDPPKWLEQAANRAAGYQRAREVVTTVAYVQPIPTGTYNAAPGSFQQCVIQRESGGNPDAQNPYSTASGLYGFLDSTWTGVTGLPGPARDYSVAVQNAAFAKAYAESGTADWASYDGC